MYIIMSLIVTSTMTGDRGMSDATGKWSWWVIDVEIISLVAIVIGDRAMSDATGKWWTIDVDTVAIVI